jgi:hypothetical protein
MFGLSIVASTNGAPQPDPPSRPHSPVSTPFTYVHLSNFTAPGLSKHWMNHSPLASRLLAVTREEAGIGHRRVLEHFAQEMVAVTGRAEIANVGTSQESKRPQELQLMGRVTLKGLLTGWAQTYS